MPELIVTDIDIAVPSKVAAMAELVESFGNIARITPKVSDVIGTAWVSWSIDFTSLEEHPLLSTFGWLLFRTFTGRTKFVGGKLYSGASTIDIKTYRDASIVLDVYTTRERPQR